MTGGAADVNTCLDRARVRLGDLTNELRGLVCVERLAVRAVFDDSLDSVACLTEQQLPSVDVGLGILHEQIDARLSAITQQLEQLATLAAAPPPAGPGPRRVVRRGASPLRPVTPSTNGGGSAA